MTRPVPTPDGSRLGRTSDEDLEVDIGQVLEDVYPYLETVSPQFGDEMGHSMCEAVEGTIADAA